MHLMESQRETGDLILDMWPLRPAVQSHESSAGSRILSFDAPLVPGRKFQCAQCPGLNPVESYLGDLTFQMSYQKHLFSLDICLGLRGICFKLRRFGMVGRSSAMYSRSLQRSNEVLGVALCTMFSKISVFLAHAGVRGLLCRVIVAPCID